jgi:hypothetical protein
MAKGSGGTRGAAGGGRSGGWPTLTGSEKQVAWANDLRDRADKALQSIIPYATTPQAKQVVAKIKEGMKSHTDAKFWIDNRYNAPRAFSNPSSPSAANSAVHEVVMGFHSMFNLKK